MKRIWAAFSLILVLSLPAFAGTGKLYIRPGRVYGMMKTGSGLWFIDVRNPNAFGQVHAEDSMNIPFIELQYQKFSPGKVFVLIDASPGQKSALEAARLLIKEGCKKVYVVEGGLPGWKLQGYPVAVHNFKAFGLTAQELSSALADSIPVKIFDLRPSKEVAKGSIHGSNHVPGKDIDQKISNLKKILSVSGSLAEKISAQPIAVLVLPAGMDARELTEIVSIGTKKDIRYLIGGYQAYAALGKDAKKIESGFCPSCEARTKK